MQFRDSVNQLSSAVGFLSMCMINASHGADLPPMDQQEAALNDAARAVADLYSMGHQHTVAAMMQMSESVSWWGSAHQEYEAHEGEAVSLFQAICERMMELPVEDDVSSHLLSHEEENTEEVFEFSADKEHLARCLSIS
jgi:predicted translin family RNA/ssDNA-binding protein